MARAFDIVCFDCDSTLSTIEGIDALARQAGVEEAVAPLTTAAMTGALSLDAVYAKRLDLVRPDRASMAWLGERYVDAMVPGARETVEVLAGAGTAVHLVSGGLRQALLPLGKALGVPEANVHAVDVTFEEDGSYCGFDAQSPLVRPDGKAQVCRGLGGEGPIALVGDGVTDLAARDAGVFVIGFGGVAKRDAVIDGADVFVPGPALTAVLDHLLPSRAWRPARADLTQR